MPNASRGAHKNALAQLASDSHCESIFFGESKCLIPEQRLTHCPPNSAGNMIATHSCPGLCTLVRCLCAPAHICSNAAMPLYSTSLCCSKRSCSSDFFTYSHATTAHNLTHKSLCLWCTSVPCFQSALHMQSCPPCYCSQGLLQALGDVQHIAGSPDDVRFDAVNFLLHILRYAPQWR